MTFVNLNTITSYSTLNSTIKIPNLISVAKKRGYSALAITDFNVMHGVIQFYDLCKKNKLKPLIGMTLVVPGLNPNITVKIVLLAKNVKGYHQLLKISTLINVRQTPTNLVDFKDYFSDLVAIIHPQANEVICDNFSQIIDTINQYHLIFSDLYLGYSPYQTNLTKLASYQKIYENKLLKIVYMNEVRYLNAEDAVVLKVLRAIDQQDKLDPLDPLVTSPGQDELKSAEEVKNGSKGDLFDAIFNANELAQKLNVEILKEKTELPHFKSKFNSSFEYLVSLVKKGLRELHKDQDPIYQKRAKYELETIKNMGFSDYFLIIWDIINYANSSNIQLGAGRGSAAGSLVAYALGISKVDPVEYGLLFERFLNPERVNMPDIDLDVPDDKRIEIIEYLKKRYGKDNFAQIITFSTLGVKQGIRDCLRVFGADNQTVNKWIKAVPKIFHVNLDQCYKESASFRELVNADKFGNLLYDILKKIEGLPRQASIHAAGVVISEKKLVDKIPLQRGSNDILLTQYIYHDVEELGLLKIDILGLKNLSILKKMVNLIHKYNNPNFKIESVKLNDPDTLQIFHDADTDGVFQFESSGLKRVLVNLDVTNFSDIVAANALYRPGPMRQINTYIDHKKHKNEPYDPDLVPLKPIVDSTYGVIVYQEQVMQVAHMMAGFPLSEADMLRRAMSKKNHRLLEKYQSKFIDGALKNGYSQKQAKKVYDLIEYFSNYGFNKSHSVAYSMLAFWLAYIKAHFPIHFFTVQLAYATGDLSRMRVFINSAKKRKIQVIAPNINQSVLNFSNNGQKIISGLIVIKGLRRDFISEIVKKRLKYGIYKDLNDFLNRLNQRFLKVDNFIPLIKAGACDRLHKNRRELLENLQMSLDSIKFSQNNITLFQQLKPRWDNYPDFSYEEKITMEYDLTGLYLNGGPFDQFEELAKIYHPQKIKSLEQRKNSWLFVTLSKIRVIKDKNKQKMAFVTLDDAEDQIDGVIFANRYFDLYPNLVETKKVGVYGQLRRQKEQSFIINKLFLLSTAKDAFDHEKLFIDITKISNTNLQNLRKLLRQCPGLSPVFLIDNDNNKNVLLNPDNWVNVTNVFYRKLLTLVGQSHVVFQKERENENL